MPWLIRETEGQDPSEALLFIHIPRCGGTSLTKHFNVIWRAMSTVCLLRKLTLLYFGYRYRVLEESNFPMATWENGMALGMLAFALGFGFGSGVWMPWLFFSATMLFLTSTILFTAPLLRYNWVRRLMLTMGSLIGSYSGRFLYGGAIAGFYIHFTAQRMVETNEVESETLRRVTSFALTRNPYSRMVSVYKYNKLGKFETFKDFVRRWKSMHEDLKKRTTEKSIQEWDAYCHLLPQHAFTHDADGEQLVRFAVKLEEVESLQSDMPGPSVSDLPTALREVCSSRLTLCPISSSLPFAFLNATSVLFC